ncbi:LIM domain kinase 1 [Eumeta japonica]|uniref:LIM domain kinase 1 n=1 Tax=Eumeta variegata TaxID=151549 RepID=A0A4C1Y6N6_EUMVA|nr:LIM domain kinase 1 [Eumeta japonica]
MEGSDLKGPLNCGGCLNTIVDDSYVSALDHNWHTDCFRCSVCDDPLSSWYFEKDGLLFCQTDYWVRYGESCQQCGQVITGPVMSAGDHRFHPECFACVSCGANIEDGEPYALVERSKLYCGSCYDMNMRSAHAIRVLPVPGGALRLATTSGDNLTVKESCVTPRSTSLFTKCEPVASRRSCVSSRLLRIRVRYVPESQLCGMPVRGVRHGAHDGGLAKHLLGFPRFKILGHLWLQVAQTCGHYPSPGRQSADTHTVWHVQGITVYFISLC